MNFDIEDPICIDFARGFKTSKKFSEKFRKKFSVIKAYHATNISQSEFDAIKQSGLRIASVELLKQKAIDRFIRTSDPVHVQKKILIEIDKGFLDLSLFNIGQIHLGLVKNELITRSYHYLLFGPESLLPLAYKLRNEFHLPFKTRMIEFGKPHIVCANVPVEKTSDRRINGIFEYIVNRWVECSTVCFEDIPASNIINIERVGKPKDLNNFEYL